MRSIVAIDFACNDPDNGVFAGRAAMASYGGAELEAPSLQGFAFTDFGDAIRVHRRKFKIVRASEWFGNWCWNRYWLDRDEAKRLLRTLRLHGWKATSGPARFRRWMNHWRLR